MPQKRVYEEIRRMKRGKPRKRETQNMVGESSEENKNPKKNDIMSQINIYRLAIGTEHGL